MRFTGAVLQTDEELARQIAPGTANQALTVLVERHHSPLLGYLYRMTGGDRVLAEDLAQETFLRLMRAISQYKYPRPFKPWMYQIATNLARDHYKRAETQHTIDAGLDKLIEDTAPAQIEDGLYADEAARQVIEALRDLSEHQREVVILRFYQDLSLAEIADTLSIPVGTVKSRLSLGLQRLRDQMEREPNYD